MIDLVGQLGGDASEFAKAEIALAKAKVSNAAARYKAAAAFFAVGGVLALAALIAMLVGLIQTLATVVGPGFATLIVTLVTLVIAGGLAFAGQGAVVAMIEPDDLEQAEARVTEARARLSGTVETLQSRLAPRALAKNALTSVGEGGQRATDAAKRNPAVVAGVVALFAGLLGRRAIFGWAKDAFAKARARRAKPPQPRPAPRVRKKSVPPRATRRTRT